MKKYVNSFEKFKDYFIYFMIYSIIGWLYEVFLEVAVYRWGFTNRGVLFGPYLPVYGVGALIFLFLIYPLIKYKSKKTRLILLPVIFVLCAVTATVVELVVSYICEFTLGYWPWQTYANDYTIHFQGRIALSPSVRFGLGGLLFLYILQPLFEKFTLSITDWFKNLIFGILFTAVTVDTLYFIFKMIFI